MDPRVREDGSVFFDYRMQYSRLASTGRRERGIGAMPTECCQDADSRKATTHICLNKCVKLRLTVSVSGRFLSFRSA